MMRHDYIDSLLAKKSIEQWCNLTRTEVINHTLRGTKLYRDYQRAIKHDNSVVGYDVNPYAGTMLDGATRRDDYIHGT